MSDLSPTIVAKSDQLNADDLLGGPRTIRITDVRILGGDQPVAVHYDGDQGKPWKPCKSMRRVLVKAWGGDSSAYRGRRITVFNDPTVKWGGAEVGGVRISHMSDIGDRPLTVSLTVTKGTKKPTTILPIKAAPAGRPETNRDTEIERASREGRLAQSLFAKAREGSFEFEQAWGKLDDRRRSAAAWLKPELDTIADEADEAAEIGDGTAGQSGDGAPLDGDSSQTSAPA